MVMEGMVSPRRLGFGSGQEQVAWGLARPLANIHQRLRNLTDKARRQFEWSGSVPLALLKGTLSLAQMQQDLCHPHSLPHDGAAHRRVVRR